MQNYGAIFDFETRSELSVRDVGAYRYATHPSTEILCLGIKWRGRKALVTMDNPKWIPDLFREWYQSGEPISAHNSLFEYCILFYIMTLRHNWPVIPLSRFLCSAASAAAVGLPRALEGACEAMDLPVKKDMIGNRLMKKYMKPRRPSKNNPAKYHEDPRELKRIYQYCLNDLEAEEALLKSLPPLIPQERTLWLLDQGINLRGARVDMKSVDRAIEYVDHYKKKYAEELVQLTHGRVKSVGQNLVMKNYLEDLGCPLPNLQKATIEAALKDEDVTGEARRLLELRQLLSKSSVDKYNAFKVRASEDDVVRDLLMYHGASTGRWTGKGVQVHNFPKPIVKEIDTAISLLNHGDPDLFEACFENPFTALSSCLRSMFIPRDGKKFYCGDFSGIEARGVFWIAEEEKGLSAFREGRDLYVEMASDIYRIPKEKVTDEMRNNLGKPTILGSGFGMGWPKFQMTLEAQGQKISDELAKAAIYGYRNKFRKIPEFWNGLERAAMMAVTEGKRIRYKRGLEIFVKNDFLFIQLPSGRRLAYRAPEVKLEMTAWGETKPTLSYMAPHPKTGKWKRERTYGAKLTENVVQAIARDIMAAAMMRLEAAGFLVDFTVHDEILTEKKNGSLEEFLSLMMEVPSWAEGFPIDVEGWTRERYGKWKGVKLKDLLKGDN